VIEWLKWGGSLPGPEESGSKQSPTIPTDVSLCDALRWIEEGTKHPQGRYGEFAREVQALKLPSGRLSQSFDVEFSKSSQGCRQHVNGNAGRMGAPKFCGWRIYEPSPDLPGLISMMKSLLLALALFATVMAQKSDAAEVVRGARGTAVHTGGGTAVHTNYNWNDAYWHSHKYGYWNGQRGNWHVVNGKHVFVVL
jgi:hypothetical protein